MKAELKDAFTAAQKLRERGDFQAAKEILLDLSKKNPKSPAVFCVLGDIYWDMEFREEAIEAFRKAVHLSPKLEGPSLGLFHCLWQLTRYEEAFEEMKRFQTISDSKDYRAIIKAINESSEKEE